MIMEGPEHMELRVVNDMAESLWVMIKGQTNNTGGMSLWESNIDSLARTMMPRNYSQSTALVLMRDFNLLEIDFEHHI